MAGVRPAADAGKWDGGTGGSVGGQLSWDSDERLRGQLGLT